MLTLIRSPEVFKVQAAVSVASEATVWDPTAFKKFRLMAMDIYGDVAGAYVFKDGVSGTTIYETYLDGTTSKVLVLGMNGILSSTQGFPLRCLGPASSHITGTLYGTEE